MVFARFVAPLLAVAACLVGSFCAVAPVAADQEYTKQKMCEVCHSIAHGDMQPVTPTYKETKHAKAEGDDPRHSFNGEPHVGCQACHGPGKAHASSSKKEDIKLPEQIEDRKGRLSLCGRCHAKYEEDYLKDYTYGDDILDKVTLTEPTGEPLQQVNEMKGSKHFTADNGPTCITCHTGHKGIKEDLPHQIRKPIDELCTDCHAAQADLTHSKMTVPDGATCATCHMPERKHIIKVAPQ